VQGASWPDNQPSLPEISVIICAHNPRADYFRRVLDALKAQTLPREQWELLLVDNASKEPLAGAWDLSWHAHGRHLLETELGLTPARLRGIAESRNEIIVFVDDDNVLAPDYLEQALGVARKYPFVAAWGGRIDPEFEVHPPDWIHRFWSYLALHPVERSYWSNIATDFSLPPCGAGLCLRRSVAETYARLLSTDVQRRQFDRKGQSLVSCGDTDLVLTACDLGHAYGLFRELRLVHLIPKGRLSQDYLLRLEEEIAFSSSYLNGRRNGVMPSPPSSALRRRVVGAVRRRLTMKRMDRLVLEARLRGWDRAYAALNGTAGRA
jgi:GT2 family glycosyltransferase